MSLETELRDRFATAADALPEPDHRLDAVVRRGTRRRRTSQLLTALAVLVVVGGGVALLDANLGGRAAPVVGTPGDGPGTGTPAPSPTASATSAAGAPFDERYRWVVWPVIGPDAAAADHRPEGFQGGPSATAEALVREWYPDAIGVTANTVVDEPDGDGTWFLVDVIGDEAVVAVLVDKIDDTYWVLHAQSLAGARVELERVDAQRVGFSGQFPGQRDARVRIEQSVRVGGSLVASRSAHVASFGVASADRWAQELPLDRGLGTVRITVTAADGGRPLLLAARDADVDREVAGPFTELPAPVADRLGATSGGWFVWWFIALVGLVLALAALAYGLETRRSRRAGHAGRHATDDGVHHAEAASRIVQMFRGGPGGGGGA